MHSTTLAANLLGDIMEPLEGPSAALERLQLEGVPSPQQLVEGRSRATQALESLHPDQQRDVYTQALDLLLPRDHRSTRFSRQILYNEGLARPYDCVEPDVRKTGARHEFPLLRHLAGTHRRAAEQAYVAWATSERGGEHPHVRSGSCREALRERAERACLRAFGPGDGRSIELLIEGLRCCVAEQNVAVAQRKLGLFHASSAVLSRAQAQAVLSTGPLAHEAIDGLSEPAERQATAQAWAHFYGWAQARLRKGEPADSQLLLVQLARLRSKVQSLGERFDSGLDDAGDSLEDLLQQMLARLEGEGAAADQLRRRALTKMREWRNGSEDSRRASETWLEKWLALASGYAPFSAPSPLPVYDRGTRAGLARPKLTRAQIDAKMALFRTAFAAEVVGNAALYGKLSTYLFAALTHGGPINVLLHGEPGTAKTLIADIVQRTLFADHHAFTKNIGGAEAVSTIAGVSPNYHGAEFSLFAEGLANRRGRQVFFFVDEIDHTSPAVQDSLATALGCSDNAPFHDGYLHVPLQLQGDVMFFACNELAALQRQLHSRFSRALILPTQVLDAADRREAIWRHYKAAWKRAFTGLTLGEKDVADAPFEQVGNHFLHPSFFAQLQTKFGEEPGLRASYSAVERVVEAAHRSGNKQAWQFPLHARHLAMTNYEDWCTTLLEDGARTNERGVRRQFFTIEVGFFLHGAAVASPSHTVEVADIADANVRYVMKLAPQTVHHTVVAQGQGNSTEFSLHEVEFVHPNTTIGAFDGSIAVEGKPCVFYRSDRVAHFGQTDPSAPVALEARQRLVVYRARCSRIPLA